MHMSNLNLTVGHMTQSSHKLLTSKTQHSKYLYGHMAGCSKAHAFKAALFVCFLLLLLNILNSHLDARSKDSFSFTHSSHHWPKGPRNGPTTSQNNSNNIYTLIWNADNTSVKNITFHSPIISSHPHNGILLIDSTDFKRKFDNHKLNPQNQTVANSSTTSTTTKVPSLSMDLGVTKSGLLDMVMTTLGFKTCPLVPPELEGPIEVDTKLEAFEVIEQRFQNRLQPGGWYNPNECKARDSVAIIVPFRDRYAHLPIFLKNIHPFLMKQQIRYGVFIIEQTNGKQFNRAALMNVGFLEASKLYDWDCFIFHDVDLLPLDDRNLYTCPDQPRHMSVAIDIFGFKLPYNSIFGGVSAMTKAQFKEVNGFSNSFWGWGGEDDDMYNRLNHAHFHISRYPVNIARYIMLNHQKEKANPKRYENLNNGPKKFSTDGLNSVKYEVYSSKKYKLFTWFLVELKMSEHR